MTVAPELHVDGKSIRLGTQLGKGGEGEVYAIENDHTRAVKIYTVSDRASREAKIVTMIRVGLSKKTPLVAFPVGLARTREGKFVGFVMGRIAGHRALHDLYAPGSRKHKFPFADYRFLVRAAANIARAVASVHQSGCVIGDINHSSILISDKAIAALIDADSFQLSSEGQRFLCKVGVPEYTPPELQGQPLGQVVRTPNHDAFGLAVVIFQLLFMGRHPFVGTVRKGEMPPLHESIRDYRFAYAEHRDVGMDQPPGTPALSDFSRSIAHSFERAFSREDRDSRPTAQEWVQALTELENSLSACKANPLHYFPKDAEGCPWCEMEQQVGTVLFLPFVPGAEITVHPFDPGASGFNLEEIWNRIQSVKCVRRIDLKPLTTSITLAPSVEATATNSSNYKVWYRIGSFVAGVALAAFVPAAWIFWLPLILYGVFASSEKQRPDGEPFLRKYREAEARRLTAQMDWYRRVGIDELESLRTTLEESARAYRNLSSEEKSQVDKYNSGRRSHQLHAFLDDFEIRDARIKGVGPAKQAVLDSYGVETAADVSLERLLTVPGFGPVNSKGLLDWRRKIEARFVFNSQSNERDKQEIARIRTAIASKGAEIRRSLLAGPKNLELLSARVRAAAGVADPIFARFQNERDQAECDLKLLGIPLPHVAPPAPQVQQPLGRSGPLTNPRPSQTTAPTTGPQTRTASPHCPRCGSSMIRRTARRGRRPGNTFWGCSRFPQCRGSRS